MNTPRTKPPTRYDRSKHKVEPSPSGNYALDLQDPTFLMNLGAIAARWPQVEERMNRVLGDLLGVTDGAVPLRQLFRSIVNAQIRITIMRNLLERAPRNADKGLEYDELLNEFAAVNVLRNKYLHGLWTTYQDGTVYFAEPTTDDFWFHTKRKATVEELEAVLIRISGLHDRFNTMIRKRHADAQRTLSQIPSQQPDEGSP